MATVQKYLNPITLEAKMFVESLEAMAGTYNALDDNLIEALENVMMAIEKFLDKSSTNDEIVETSSTKLVDCSNGLQDIQRVYRCLLCQRDIGVSIAKMALHMTRGCGIIRLPYVSKETQQMLKQQERDQRRQKRSDTRAVQKDMRLSAAVKINKKTTAFLSMDYTSLCTFLNDFVQVGEKLKCLPDYNDIENDIMEIIKPVFPQQTIKIYKFGSRLTGIGTRESDLDIFIDIGERFRIYEHRPTKESLVPLHKLRDAMNVHRKSWSNIVPILSARVPILKTIHSKTGIECDINLTNSLGCINTQLLDYLFSLQPIALLMCIYMKKWLARTNQKGDFSTYSMSIMVIFYLQQQSLFPPISKFFENVDKESALTVGPWVCSFVRLTLKDLGLQMSETSNLMRYIKGFFQFYVKIDFKSFVICPYVGKLIRKQDVYSGMPGRYLSYVIANKDVELALNKEIVVRDPIQLNNNVTKNLSDFNVRVFKEMMIRSLEIIHLNNLESTVPTNQA